MTPTYLYIKRHRITGLLYLGKTIRQDPYSYCGSGTRWKRHIAKHGKIYIDTIYCELFTEVNDLIECAIFLSEFYEVVNSPGWANLIVENGLDGSAPGRKESVATLLKKSIANTGKRRTLEQRINISEAHRGLIRSPESIDKFIKTVTGRRVSEETRAKISVTSKNRTPSPESIQKMRDTKAARKHIPKKGWTAESKANMSVVAKKREANRRSLDPTKPLVVTNTARTAGTINQTIATDANHTVVTRV